MIWAHWVLIVLPAAWAGFMAWLAYGPLRLLDPANCNGANCQWCKDMSDYFDEEARRLEQPVREACALDVREEVEWQRITEREAS